MSKNIVHETVLREIIDLIDPVVATSKSNIKQKLIGSKEDTYQFRSLTRNTNDLILVFPVLCTKGISVETASMLSKAIEKKCVTLLQMLFASVQIAGMGQDGEYITNLQSYLSKFHSNIKLNSDNFTVDNLISLVGEGVDSGDIKITDKELYNRFKDELQDIQNIAKSSMNEYSLADFKCHRNSRSFDVVLEDNAPDNSTGKRATRFTKEFTEQLTLNDIKKANELMPTKVLINFKVQTGPDTITALENAVIGVKCKLYPVDSLEIISRVSSKYKDTNWLQQFVRASTHEISFVRDFLFAIDRAKLDAVSANRKGSSAKMFKVLESRARLYKATAKKNKADCAPITTFVISQDELEYLKKDYDINLEDRNTAMKIMQGYNFMGLAIVDEPAESVEFMWDEGGNSNFETLSFRSLERESDDKNYRKVINLMTKISR